jgi:hypothetical protein
MREIFMFDDEDDLDIELAKWSAEEDGEPDNWKEHLPDKD